MNVSIAAKQTHALSAITYTQTPSISASAELMRERRLVMGLKNYPHAGVFRLLRTNLLMQMREKNWNSIAVVAPTPECGKTFLTANLAIALAMEVNQTVLIVDADLHNPQLGWYFGLDAEKGLLDYLQGDTPVEDLLVNPGFERLVLLPSRPAASASSELLSLPKMAALVEEIKTRYASRIVLFDLPPLLSSDDALLFMPHFDAALLVVEDGKTTPDEVRRSLAILDQTNLAGTVLNKAKNDQLPQYGRSGS